MGDKKSDTDGKKAVRLNDGFGTIIYVDKNADPEKAIAKYLKDIEDYQKSSVMLFNKGNIKPRKK